MSVGDAGHLFSASGGGWGHVSADSAHVRGSSRLAMADPYTAFKQYLIDTIVARRLYTDNDLLEFFEHALATKTRGLDTQICQAIVQQLNSELDMEPEADIVQLAATPYGQATSLARRHIADASTVTPAAVGEVPLAVASGAPKAATAVNDKRPHDEEDSGHDSGAGGHQPTKAEVAQLEATSADAAATVQPLPRTHADQDCAGDGDERGTHQGALATGPTAGTAEQRGPALVGEDDYLQAIRYESSGAAASVGDSDRFHRR